MPKLFPFVLSRCCLGSNPCKAGQGLYKDSEHLAHGPTRPILSRDNRAVAYKDTGASPRRRSAAFCKMRPCRVGLPRLGARGWQDGAPRVGQHYGGGLQPRAKAARPGPPPACGGRGCAPRAGRMRWEHTLPARLGAGLRAGGASRPERRGRQLAPRSPVRPAPSADPRAGRGLRDPARDAARLPLGSPPPLGRAGLGGRLRAAPAQGLGYLGGCWWLGSFPDGRGTSGRGSGGRTRREGGRNPSAEALAGRRAGRRLQTLGRQSRWRRWRRRLLLRLPQDLPRAGPRWRRSLHRVSCHPRNGPDHKRRGEDARAASGARKRVVETNLMATPLPQFAPPE